MLSAFGSISAIVLAEDYEKEFLPIENFGKTKVDSLTACFKGSIEH